jgi:hypothetical protein
MNQTTLIEIDQNACYHPIYNYMRLLVICDLWTFLQLFFMLVTFVITLQLIYDYFDFHPSI